MVAELEKVFFTNFQNYFLDILQDTNIPGLVQSKRHSSTDVWSFNADTSTVLLMK